MSKNDLKIVSYLAGFHLKKLDHDFRTNSGKLFNFLSEILETEFDVVDLDVDLILLKPKDNNVKYFGVRFDKGAIV
jgi:hypothetical protein